MIEEINKNKEIEYQRKIDDLDLDFMSAQLKLLFKNIYTKKVLSDFSLKKIEKFIKISEKKEDKNEFLKIVFLKILLKTNIENLLDTKLDSILNSELFSQFSKVVTVTANEFNKIFSSAKVELRDEYLRSKEMINIMRECRSELPDALSRVYNINCGLETKNDGTILTLVEFSKITKFPHKINLKYLDNARTLLDIKIKRRLNAD